MSQSFLIIYRNIVLCASITTFFIPFYSFAKYIIFDEQSTLSTLVLMKYQRLFTRAYQSIQLLYWAVTIKNIQSKLTSNYEGNSSKRNVSVSFS